MRLGEWETGLLTDLGVRRFGKLEDWETEGLGD